MSVRYVTNVVAALLAGFVVVVSQSFRPAVLGWVAFGIAIGVVAMIGLAQMERSRGVVQRAMDVGMVVVGGLLIAFSVASSGTATTWLSFAFALGIVVIAVAGLTANEVSNWRERNQLGDLHWLHHAPALAAHRESHAA